VRGAAGPGAVPAVSDVEAICAIPDPIVRNLRITQAYGEMSRALSARTGPGANWCTFATWASKQAGQTILDAPVADPSELRRRLLGRDLAGAFPGTLQTLVNPDLVALLATLDPTPDTPEGSGAMDWANLPQRMHFIADLFRTRHEVASCSVRPSRRSRLG
jgi:hypothetical protein